MLDTSAIRSISSKLLQAMARQKPIYVSPYCFWEILCHLDENEKFSRFKDLLMKFKYVEVLDNPYTLFKTSFLPEDLDLQARVTEDDVIYATLAALQASDSLNTFYSAYIEDSQGNIRQITNCADRSRKILDKYEEDYTNFIREIVEAIQLGKVELKTNDDYYQAILDLIDGEVIKLKRQGVELELREKVISDAYFYYSYIFFRALKYSKCGTTNVDKNDFEDSNLCLHLRLNSSYILVTADKGMRNALNEAIITLEKLEKPGLNTTLQIKEVKDFQSLS